MITILAILPLFGKNGDSFANVRVVQKSQYFVTKFIIVSQIVSIRRFFLNHLIGLRFLSST
jgi:hypothetical protein